MHATYKPHVFKNLHIKTASYSYLMYSANIELLILAEGSGTDDVSADPVDSR